VKRTGAGHSSWSLHRNAVLPSQHLLGCNLSMPATSRRWAILKPAESTGFCSVQCSPMAHP